MSPLGGRTSGRVARLGGADAARVRALRKVLGPVSIDCSDATFVATKVNIVYILLQPVYSRMIYLFVT